MFDATRLFLAVFSHSLPPVISVEHLSATIVIAIRYDVNTLVLPYIWLHDSECAKIALRVLRPGAAYG